MKWAISLILGDEEKIENRVLNVLKHILNSAHQHECFLSDIDATGPIGNDFTQRLNVENGKISISSDELLAIFSEDGQVFELNLFLNSSENFQIIIRDGFSVDILSDGPALPQIVTGDFEKLDLDLF